jgi:N utilization substance protein B
MTSRREARRQAIDVLYQADMTAKDPRVVLVEWQAAGRDLDPFAEELVEGVAASLEELDRVLAGYAEHWTLDRMASVDRTILRLATYEILHRPDIPVGAAIDEAIRVANDLSTEDSGRFVNGVLGRVAQDASAGRGPGT